MYLTTKTSAVLFGATVFVGSGFTIYNLSLYIHTKRVIKKNLDDLELGFEALKNTQTRIVQEIRDGKWDNNTAGMLEAMMQEMDFQQIAVRTEKES